MIWSTVQANVLSPVFAAGIAQAEYLALQSIPYALYGCAARRLSWRRRLVWVAAVVSLVLVAVTQPVYGVRLAAVALALVYYLIIAIGIHWMQPAVAAGLVRKDALFCIAAAALIFVPVGLFRTFSAVPMLVFGWNMTLSAYSYCVEAGRAHRPANFKSCVFFLMVDPTLVYARRATPRAQPMSPAKPLLRIVTGLSLMTIGTYAIGFIIAFAPSMSSDASLLGKYGVTMLTALSLFLAMYWLRAGFADVQIATMQTLAHDVGECYVRPYLATNPVEFWRRWNVYVGNWAERYVFTPLSLSLLRYFRRSGRHAVRLDKAVGVLVTFVFIGLLHDALNYAGEATTRFHFLVVFSFGAVALLAWEGAASLLRSRRALAAVPAARPWFAALSWLCFAHYLAGLMALSGGLP
jgi:D-alanyl-lipoteichoic acid acyltransferase DltB (MBOAT superfamily)